MRGTLNIYSLSLEWINALFGHCDEKHRSSLLASAHQLPVPEKQLSHLTSSCSIGTWTSKLIAYVRN